MPWLSVTGALTVDQFGHAPVPGNARSSRASTPFTARSIGRLVVVPLANRTVTVAGPAVAAFTVNST